ncbi:MAG TPA: methyltransferase [Armatimonadota bacterium]|jgi:precorrin-6B methylase 2
MSHTGDELLGMARGFMSARVLLTGAELGLYTLLDGQRMGVEEVAERVGADLRAVTMLSDALVSLGILSKEGDRYQLAEEAHSLSAQAPDTILPMVLHGAGLWKRWSQLTEAVTTGQPGSAGSGGFDPAQMRAFIGAMHVVGTPVADRIVRAVVPGSASRLLDIGGASGTYTIAFLKASPALKATLFDRNGVIEMARERLTGAGLLDRVALVPGDFYSDPLPEGHDLALLSAIIHQNSREQNRELYTKTLRALVPGGRLVVRDHVMSEDHTQPPSGALFALNMLTATQGGGTYSLSETTEDLEAAGFERVRLLQPDTNMDGLVEAWRP